VPSSEFRVRGSLTRNPEPGTRNSEPSIRLDELSVLPGRREHVLALERVMPIGAERLCWCRRDTLEAVQVLDRIAQLGRIRPTLRQRHQHHARRVVRLGRGDREWILVVGLQHLLMEVARRRALVWCEGGDGQHASGQLLNSQLGYEWVAPAPRARGLDLVV